MPPKIALLLCTAFVLVVFILDFKRKPKVTYALWIPLIWMSIVASRMISLWFNTGGFAASPEAYEQGSPIDRAIFIVLIVIGLTILFRRRVRWFEIFRDNIWIFAFFLYCAASILWSDFPMVSLKRLVKAVGNPIMILIILTDPYPVQAVKTVLRRCSYVLIPFSIVLIKYYPLLGRSYNRYSGELQAQGVSTGGNALGLLCLFSGLYFVWAFFSSRAEGRNLQDKKLLIVHALYIIMTIWLFNLANSATSFICFLTGSCIIVCLEIPAVRRRVARISLYLLILALFISPVLFLGYDYILGSFVDLTGHADTFWGRAELWPEFIGMMNKSPLTGNGYGSFWLGDNMATLWDKYWWHPTEAHNGYVETYLELGLIGLVLLFGILLSSYKKIVNALTTDFALARLRIAVLFIALLYNITESAFKGLHLMWLMFLLVAIDVGSHCTSTPIKETPEKNNPYIYETDES